MIRSTHFLRIIEKENLVENARVVGEHFLKALQQLQSEQPIITAVRGRGLFIAFDLPDSRTRDEFWKGVFDRGLLVLKSGDHSIRFRPALDITTEIVDEAVGLLRAQCQQLRK
jgi:L-lysine 6-transaminase